MVALCGSGPIRLRGISPHPAALHPHLISRGFLKIEWAAGRGQTAHLGRNEPFDTKRMPRAVFSAFDLRFSYHPPSGVQGISLGLVRQYRCGKAALIEWGGHTHPPLHHARVQKPSFYISASRCVRSLRLLSVSGLLSCSGSHSAAAPFAFVPRLLETS